MIFIFQRHAQKEGICEQTNSFQSDTSGLLFYSYSLFFLFSFQVWLWLSCFCAVPLSHHSEVLKSETKPKLGHNLRLNYLDLNMSFAKQRSVAIARGQCVNPGASAVYFTTRIAELLNLPTSSLLQISENKQTISS